MRKLFGQLIADALVQDSRIWLLTGDLGFGVLDQARACAPDRALNVGAAEQLMLGAAVGLAHCDKIPIVYSITPFAIYRPFEYLRNYLNHEKANVKIVGAGRDKDYGNNGFSHWADDDKEVMSVFQHIDKWWPQDEEELQNKFQSWLYASGPAYLNLRR